jgi:hypothetical protein
MQIGSWASNVHVTVAGRDETPPPSDYWVVKLEGLFGKNGNGLVSVPSGSKCGPAIPNRHNVAFIVDDRTGEVVETNPYG